MKRTLLLVLLLALAAAPVPAQESAISSPPGSSAPPGTGITTLNTLIATTQTFANDTNVAMVSAATTHTLTWLGVLATSRGGLGVALSDPNADRLLFWDDSAGAHAYLTLGTNLSITGTTINATGGGSGLLSLEGQTGNTQTFTDDTNVTIVSGSDAHVITWAGVLAMNRGGLGVALSDPNADRILFWDDSAGAHTYLTLGTNLSITGTTLDAAGGGGSVATDSIWDTAGDIAVATGANTAAKLPIGSDGQVLKVVAGAVAWAADATGGAGSVNIGDAIGSGTATRVLFEGAGPVFADDAGLTYNSSTDTLTAGGYSMGAAGVFTFAERSAPSVSSANTATLYFDSTSDTLKISENGGAYVDLADFGSYVTAVEGIGGGAVDLAISTTDITGDVGISTASNVVTIHLPSVGPGVRGLVAAADTTFPSFRYTFAPSATKAGVNVGTIAGDPSSPTDGDIWYDGTAEELTARINGANVALGAGGGGSVATDSIWDAVGDLVVGTGANTAARLALGSNGDVLTISGGAVVWGMIAGSGDVTAAAAFANDNRLIRSDGTSKGVQASGVTLDDSANLSGIAGLTLTGAFTLPDGVRQTFNPDTTNAGINVGAFAGDPSSPSDGDLWYDSASNELTARINGTNVALGAGGGSGLTSLEGQTGATQTFTDDTNVTIVSGSNAHVITWAGVLAMDRGGLGVALSDPNADRLLFWDDSAGAYDYLTLGTNLSITGTTINASGGGLGSGQRIAVLYPESASAPATLGATFDTRAGTSTPAENFTVLDFDASTVEYADFKVALPASYAGGGLTFTIAWSATSATSGDVIWSAAVRAFPSDAEDVDGSHTYDYNNSSAATTASASGEIIYTTITFSNGTDMDSWAAGEVAIIRVRRFASDSGDTMTGDAELVSIAVRET
jgi:hypothetical protein